MQFLVQKEAINMYIVKYRWTGDSRVREQEFKEKSDADNFVNGLQGLIVIEYIGKC
jgi:hypothetical protein